MKALFISVLALIVFGMNTTLTAQLIDAERSQLRKGNRAYESGDLPASQQAYEQALEKNEFNPTGHYNLGNTLYGLTPDSVDRVADHFQKAANYSENDDTRARAYHNLGNTYMRGGKYKESVEAYKQALRLNPKDEDTRYNLAYALEKLRQQQQQQNQDQQDDKKENEDENQDKNQDQDKQDQDNQDQDKQDPEESENQDEQDQSQEDQEQENQEQQNKDQQDSKEQKPSQQMSKEEIEQMLEALRYQEEKLQEKMQKKKVKGKKVKGEKDW